MVEPTTLLGMCLTKGFLAGVVGNVVASVIYDTGKGVTTDLAKLVAADLQQGRLPANHDLAKLAHRSLRSALLFAHASCAHTIGDKQPFLPAMMKAWKENRLFDQPLIRVRDTAEHTWLERFRKAIVDDAAFAGFDGTGSSLDEINAANLAATQLDAVLQQALKARLNDWVARHVEYPPPPLQRQVCFEAGLDDGFPIDGDPQCRLTVYAAWCLFFREGLKDDNDERPFKAYVIAKLDELSSRGDGTFDTEAIAESVSDKLSDKLAERVPDVEYFDDQFKALNAKMDEALDLLRRERLAVLPEAGALAPPRRDFVGRAAIRTTLAERIRDGESQHIVGVHGQGGVGKTELAVVVGHDVIDRFPGGQLLINLQGDKPNPPGPAQAIATLMPQLGVNGKLPDKLDALVGIYAGQLQKVVAQRGPVLLVLDNAASEAQIEPLLPLPPCVALVTSRQYFTIQGVEPESLDVLTEQEALELAGQLCPRLTDDEALELVTGCDRLALAINTLAKAIAHARTRQPADILAAFASDRLRHLPRVQAALQTSYELLDEPLRNAWRSLSAFAGSFPRHLAHPLLGNDTQAATDEQLDALFNAALLEYDPPSGRFDFHDLAREFAWNLAVPDDDTRFSLSRRHAEMFMAVLYAADRLYLDGKPLEGLSMLDGELANVVAGQAWAADHWPHDAAACRLAAKYYGAGVYVLNLRLPSTTQIAWLETARDACRKLGDRRGEGNALGNLGLAVARLGDAREAIEYHEQALKVLREIGDRRGEANALGNLGNAHAALGDAPKAIEYHEQRLVIAREIGDRRGEGNALGNLGNAHLALGDAPKSIEYHEQALKVSREIGDRRAEGQDLGNLGIAHNNLGDAPKAIGYFGQQLAITREIGDRRGEGSARFNRGLLLDKEERWCEAADDMEQAAAICAAIEDPSAARAAELAADYRRQCEAGA